MLKSIVKIIESKEASIKRSVKYEEIIFLHQYFQENDRAVFWSILNHEKSRLLYLMRLSQVERQKALNLLPLESRALLKYCLLHMCDSGAALVESLIYDDPNEEFVEDVSTLFATAALQASSHAALYPIWMFEQPSPFLKD